MLAVDSLWRRVQLDCSSGLGAVAGSSPLRKGYKRKQGHRQELTKIEILDLGGGSSAPAKEAKKASKEEEAEAKPEDAEAPEEAEEAQEAAATESEPEEAKADDAAASEESDEDVKSDKGASDGS